MKSCAINNAILETLFPLGQKLVKEASAQGNNPKD
jgi:hypothetical protein